MYPAQAILWANISAFRYRALRYKFDPGRRILRYAQAYASVWTDRALVWRIDREGIRVVFQLLWTTLYQSHHCLLQISFIPAQWFGSVVQCLLLASVLHQVWRNRSLWADLLLGAYIGLWNRFSYKLVLSDHGRAAAPFILRCLWQVILNR